MKTNVIQNIILSDQNGLQPIIGLGTYLLNENAYEILKNAIQLGYRQIDTAQMYQNEHIIGEALDKIFKEKIIKREDLFIVTKLLSENKNNVTASLIESLNKLKLNYVDQFLVHTPFGYFDNKGLLIYIPLYKVWQQMEEIVKLGLAKTIGVSNFNVQLLMDLMSYAKIKPVVNQVEIYPYLQQPELIEYCHAVGVRVVGYGNFTRNKTKVCEDQTIANIANKMHKSPYQIDLQIICLPKTSNLERLKENIESLNFRLEKDDVDKMRKLDKNERIQIMKQRTKYNIFA